MVTIKIDEHLVGNVKAILALRNCGMSDCEIQQMADKQAEKDAKNKSIQENEIKTILRESEG